MRIMENKPRWCLRSLNMNISIVTMETKHEKQEVDETETTCQSQVFSQ